MQKKLGLALSSGAGRGFAHIGVIKVLEKEGIEISCLSGSSIGALVAAHYALYRDINALEELAYKFTKRELFKLLDIKKPKDAFLKGIKLRKFLVENFYGEATFLDVKIPLAIATTALETGNTYPIRTGKIVDAVIASASIPGVLPPLKLEGLHLIDGGLADAVPLDLLSQMGAEVKVGVDLYTFRPVKTFKPTLGAILSRVYKLYVSRLSFLNPFWTDSATVIVKPNLDVGLETFTFGQAQTNIKLGEEAAREKLPEIIKKLRAK
jgi:NTE family protein